MKSDPASLQNLRDIAEPATVPWWPPAIGWWFLFAIALLATLIACYRAWLRWHANAYRRAALKQLDSARSAAAVSEVLKRTALAAYPRTDVASLSGNAWCSWLGESAHLQVTDSVRASLTTGLFREASSEDTQPLQQFARDWIQSHEGESKGHGGPKTS